MENIKASINEGRRQLGCVFAVNYPVHLKMLTELLQWWEIMQRVIYRLEKYKFYRFDETDCEPVEDKIPLGYYSNLQRLNEVIRLCNDNGVGKDDLRITEFTVKLRKNQKIIYELNYSYFIFLDNFESTYFYF